MGHSERAAISNPPPDTQVQLDAAVFQPAHHPERVRAREAAVKLLWDKRAMLPEFTEEWIDDVLDAALPFFAFAPLGDNHHNAAVCPYCSEAKA